MSPQLQDSELRWQDEILQVMFWMRGEHLGGTVTRTVLEQFLSLEPAQLDCALERLVGSRFIAVRATADDSIGAFELTDRGAEEGKRRFQEEFSPYLGRASHLTCDDPACDCSAEDFAGACPSLMADS